MKWLHKFLGEGPFIVGSIKSNFCIDRRRAMTGCKLFLSRKNVLSVKKNMPKVDRVAHTNPWHLSWYFATRWEFVSSEFREFLQCCLPFL